MNVSGKSRVRLTLNSLKDIISERPFVVTKPCKGAYALLSVAAFPCLVQNAHAVLGGFETTNGYATATADTISGAGADEVKPNGNTGAEVHTYNAGNGTGTFTNITNNTGLWRELYTARGASQIALGASTDNNKLGDQNVTGDRAYISTHTNANLATGVVLPDGKTRADLGGGILAVRSEAFGFASGDTVHGNPTNEGPYNLRFAYTPDSLDLGGRNPAALTGAERITMKFIAKINISDTDEVSGIPSPLKLSTVNNSNIRPFEMTFGGVISGNTIVNPALKIGWTDENNIAYWNGGSWVETGLTFNYAAFDEVSIEMNLATDTFDLNVRRQLNGYLTENVANDLPFAANIGTNFGVIGFELFEDPDEFNSATFDGSAGEIAKARTANGVPKTYIDNVVFTAIPEPSSFILINGFLAGLAALRRRRVKR